MANILTQCILVTNILVVLLSETFLQINYFTFKCPLTSLILGGWGQPVWKSFCGRWLSNQRLVLMDTCWRAMQLDRAFSYWSMCSPHDCLSE
jgi:hypothetical protein